MRDNIAGLDGPGEGVVNTIWKPCGNLGEGWDS